MLRRFSNAALQAAADPPGRPDPDAAADRLLTLPGLLDPAVPGERAYLAQVRDVVRLLWDTGPAHATTGAEVPGQRSWTDR